MRKVLPAAALLGLALCAPSARGNAAARRIVETRRYADATEAAGAGALFITDLDNTVMQPVRDLGSDQWFEYYAAELARSTREKSEAFRQALELYRAVGLLTDQTPVERDTASLLRQLQARGIRVMALTVRSGPMMKRAAEQLAEVGVDFRLSPPLADAAALGAEGLARYDGGILFANGLSKRAALGPFLDLLERETGFRPSKIVYIDDREPNVEDVGAAAEEKGIDFLGFRYGYLDDKIRAFDPRLSEFELACWRKSGRLVSDEQARRRDCPGN